MISQQKCDRRGPIGAGPVQRREVVAGSDCRCSAASVHHVFAHGALLFCPLLADSSRKAGDECRCLCRAVYLIRDGTRTTGWEASGKWSIWLMWLKEIVGGQSVTDNSSGPRSWDKSLVVGMCG